MADENLKPETLAEALIERGHPEVAQALITIGEIPAVKQLLEKMQQDYGNLGVEACKAGILLGFNIGARYVIEGHF